MKKLLIGLLALGSISAHAKNVAVLENGKIFSDIVSSSGTEQRKHLAKLYQRNYLNVNKKYALIRYNLDAGVFCSTSYFTDKINIIKADSRLKKGIYVVEIPSDQKQLDIQASCVSWARLDDYEYSLYMKNVMEKSVNAIIVSVDEITTPSGFDKSISDTIRTINFDAL